MACPLCPAAGWFGGWIGGYFGFAPVDHPGGRILSAAVTASLIGISVIALQTISTVSLCKDGRITLDNFALVAGKTFLMGVVYSIGVNYLLNRYVFLPNSQSEHSCCCGSNKK